MSYTPKEMLEITVSYDNLATKALVVTAKKKEKKLDPKAKVRNRGTVCVPAEKAKDKKDHFPINDADQARNALARVQQYSSKPEWWSGSLKGLQDLVARKVKAKYPKIDVGGKEKKSSIVEGRTFLKQAQAPTSKQLWDGNQKKWVPLSGNEATMPAGTIQRMFQNGQWAYFEKGNDGWKQSDQFSLTESGVTDFGGQPTGGGAQQGGGGGASSNELQKAQSVLAQTPKYKAMLGTTGPNRDGVDGRMGQHTQAALKAWREDMGFPQATDAMTIYLLNNPSERPQTAPAYDAKATNDALHGVQGYLEDYAKQSETKKVDAAEARTYMAGALDWANKTLQSIDGKLKDAKTPDQEKQQIQAMRDRVDKVRTDVGVWTKYLDTLPKTAMTRINLNRLIAKYAQQPRDPDWVKSQQPAQPATPAQPAFTPAQPATTTQQTTTTTQPAAKPAGPAAQQATPAQQQAGPRTMDPALAKRWKAFLDDNAKDIANSIEGGGGFLGIRFLGGKGGIKDFQGNDVTVEHLKRKRFEFKRNLDRMTAARGQGVEEALGEQYMNLFGQVEDDLQILLERIDTEIKKKNWEETHPGRQMHRRYVDQ